jgi:copper homeostasis protein
MKSPVTVEIVVYNIESAVHAQKGGADRIELCDNPLEGGTTPSYGVIDMVRQSLSIDVFVMIRPRGGDFVYTAYEYHAMKRDIEMCKRASVDGVVFGMLKPDGHLDKERCRKLIELARPLKVTCHRAFDVAADPFQTLEDCIEVGFDRILTSGRQPKAIQGTALLAELVKRANGRISIMAGSGVSVDNAQAIIQETGVHEVHFSAAEYVAPTYPSFNPDVSFAGSWTAPDWRARPLANTDTVAAMRKLVDHLTR